MFTLPLNSTLTQVQFETFQLAGVYNGGALNWQIDADNSGSPGSTIGSGTFTLSQNLIQSNVFVAGFGPLIEYSNVFDLSSLSATPLPAQNYFLQLSDTSRVDQLGLFWATSGSGLAFQIDGTSNDPVNNTPEPASVVLFASGLIAILAFQGRFRKQG